MGSRVVFIADSLDNAYKFQRILAELDAETSAGSTVQIKKLLVPENPIDLVVFEARGSAVESLEEVCQLVESHGWPLLVIVNEEDCATLKRLVTGCWDFVVHGASPEECAARVKLLLNGDSDPASSDVITVDTMSINLATYQVTVLDEPVDFTYLEYALLSYLVRHPGRTFSRDVLLQHVWGFDYYGGSRTVDVHVRRIRAKLGPDLAQHLETVRGVGYLWNL